VDSNITGLVTKLFSKGVYEGLLASFIYNIISIIVAFILVKFFYDKLYMKSKWGNWKIRVLNSNDSSFQGTERILRPHKAKEILQDEGVFSVYVKGVVASTNSWLNTDIASEKAKELKLVKIDNKKREIVIDLANNPKKEKQIKFTEKTQKQIDNIELLLKNLEQSIKSE